MKKSNTIQQIYKSPAWMMSPWQANAAMALFRDMVGAATLKAKYPIVEYELEEDDDEPSESYYHDYLTHEQCEAIPQGFRIGVVRLEGVMMRDDTLCQLGTRSLAQFIEQDNNTKNVLGTILLVDSGGGASNSVHDLAVAIENSKKPVVAYCDGAMCSAAYYASAYCKSIIAHVDDDMIGCIGTMIQLVDFPSSAKDSDGMMHLRIYADGSEEKNKEFEEALNGNTKLIKDNLLNPLAEKFRTDMKKKRCGCSDDQLKGRTYFAKDVVGSLIDGIGTIADAAAQVIELSQLNITNMKDFSRLQSLDSCRDLQMVDGYVSLNEEQLNEIESTLDSQATDAALACINEQTVKEQSEEISRLKESNESLNMTIAERDNTIAERDATIEELRTKLAEANHNDSQEATHMGNHKPEETDGMSPMDYCRKHEQMFH